MANYLTTDTELTSIANAIRTKGGTNAQLTFPSGFVTAINAIPTGGSPEVAATTYANNSGTKDYITLTNGGYFENTQDNYPSKWSLMNTANYWMVADSNGNVAWKGQVINLSVPNVFGTGGTDYHFGGGFKVMLTTAMNEESDPETGDPITVNDYTLEASTVPNTYTVLYFSTTAF